MEAADYDAAYTFIYSPREGTHAANLPDPVPSDVATERIQRLIALQEAHTAAAYGRLIGTEAVVLVEERSKRGASEVAGKCGRNITCNLPGDESLIGQMVPVKIVSAGHNTLRAQPL
ncbi:MAG TPA: TRAM domain-containing protein [Clostridia bacterium]|nr:TRAM domain-containing protein [Clostridia bacterium]